MSFLLPVTTPFVIHLLFNFLDFGYLFFVTFCMFFRSTSFVFVFLSYLFYLSIFAPMLKFTCCASYSYGFH